MGVGSTVWASSSVHGLIECHIDQIVSTAIWPDDIFIRCGDLLYRAHEIYANPKAAVRDMEEAIREARDSLDTVKLKLKGEQ